ncbi:hypothetical protein [Gayadomonas joobiniege]|nr:hypothetical protein [Gayadomonas joobiniege]
MQTTRKSPAMRALLEKANSYSINQTKQEWSLPVQQVIHSHKLRVHEY